VKNIDEKLTSVGEDVRKNHKTNLAHLAELSAPSGSLEEDDEPSNIEKDIDGLNVDGIKLNWVAI
jgi:hypothetical protein